MYIISTSSSQYVNTVETVEAVNKITIKKFAEDVGLSGGSYHAIFWKFWGTNVRQIRTVACISPGAIK